MFVITRFICVITWDTGLDSDDTAHDGEAAGGQGRAGATGNVREGRAGWGVAAAVKEDAGVILPFVAH